MNDWIKLEDQYPDIDKDVLCYRGNCIGDMIDVYTYKGNDIWEDSYGYWEITKYDGITHWMELPQIPTI